MVFLPSFYYCILPLLHGEVLSHLHLCVPHHLSLMQVMLGQLFILTKIGDDAAESIVLPANRRVVSAEYIV